MRVFSVLRNTARPSYLPVVAHKAYLRIRYGHDRERAAATAWASARAEDLPAWGRKIDETLWSEAESFSRTLTRSAQARVERLATAGVVLGGPASIELLHFLTRALRPETVLETGVAAGWSSAAVLAAMRANGHGHLYSSDFPCFRIPDAERHIGHVVPDHLKDAWTLRIRGDRRNLDEMLRPGVALDLVHYDSDKTRSGREFFLGRTAPHLTDRHILVMDDIQDNLAFQEYAGTQSRFRVFAYGDKFVGMAGPGLGVLEGGGAPRAIAPASGR
ncbi:class I SAM-dependent methyltransferase [Nonomuraea lactucae]|uniref:class I SAM-dependent methyltransferase n=1 Tax=Nonomuraea lactucae TaxID=2249762 RepID=UPI000DE4B474|nr:class I SAM-dependent methyltransferase [Nonomuraea lactucae]